MRRKDRQGEQGHEMHLGVDPSTFVDGALETRVNDRRRLWRSACAWACSASRVAQAILSGGARRGG